ncbi:hypothetical protein F5878DRAFT_725414 [Lentinula raphanica]|uniref:Uncharacterized protein n=1 Tax=Lentinula raphanica TaxID=153919 RepID=A0AA38UEN7_9AGAR|nr:hypothetical protein F5878DRAFT_725414 [Lentinula raphanica]
MYLLRTVFTRRSHAVHLLQLLSMIATAFALPIDSDTTERRTEQRIAARVFTAGPSSHNRASGHRELAPNLNPKNTILLSELSIAAGNIIVSEDTIVRESTIAQTPRQTRTSEAFTRVQDWVISVIIEGGAKMWTEKKKAIKNGHENWVQKKEVDPNARWLMALIPLEQLSQIGVSHQRVKDFQTIRDTASQSDFKWTLLIVDSQGPKGAKTYIDLKNTDLIFVIGRVAMTAGTRRVLTRDMREELRQYRSDKLPNVPFIYQSLCVYYALAIKHPDLVFHSFDISASTEFGRAFKEMVKEKGTGALEKLSKEEDQWEWELYERIQSGHVVLKESLWEHNNKDILEDLWDEVHPLLQYVNDPEEWDKERRERLALGESFQSPGQN